MAETLRLLKPTTLINSWHINEYESAAMWDLYSRQNAGIALQTTFKRLSESFKDNKDDTIWIGKVNYIDFKKVWMNESNIYEGFVIKRRSFEHEHELRAITALPQEGFGEGERILDESHKLRELTSPTTPKRKVNSNQLTDSGKYVPVDLDTLIEKVYLYPSAQQWFTELVKSLMEKFNISSEKLVKSELYT
jgi:hypothetical protein